MDAKGQKGGVTVELKMKNSVGQVNKYSID